MLCSRARHFIFTVSLSTLVYKWVLVNLILGGNPVWIRLILLHAIENGDKGRPDGPLGSHTDFLPYLTVYMYLNL